MCRWSGEAAAVEAKALRKVKGDEKVHPTSIHAITEPPPVKRMSLITVAVFTIIILGTLLNTTLGQYAQSLVRPLISLYLSYFNHECSNFHHYYSYFDHIIKVLLVLSLPLLKKF